MWVQRTPEEVGRWHAANEREARVQGRIVAGVVIVLVPLVLAGGVFLGLRTGVVLRITTVGSFWQRLPIFAAVSIPIAWIAYRRAMRSELAKLSRRTICPKCESGGEIASGTVCQCGGTIVSASTLKWVDDQPAA